MKKCCLSLISILFISGMFLQAITIEGEIKSIFKKIISGVKINEKISNQTVFSDENGRFSITLPLNQKKILLIFEAADFHPQTFTSLLSDNIKPIVIILIPKEHLQTEISVTAMNEKEKAISVPSAESNVSELEIKEKISESIVEVLQETPGVHFIGRGGLSITPSIRGLARRRVLILVDGCRITSDRRVGNSASFISPEMVKKIEIVRSSSSVLYGSDAIGGVIQILTHEPEDQYLGLGSLNLNLNSINQRKSSGFSLKKKLGLMRMAAGVQYTNAANYHSPNQEIYHSGYSLFTGLLNLTLQGEKRAFSVGYIGGYGKDIGKPDRNNNPDVFTFNPREENHLIKIGYRENGLIRNGRVYFSLYINPTKYHLSKTDKFSHKTEYANTDSSNYLLKLNLKKNITSHLSYQLGFDWFSRADVETENILDTADSITRSFPLRDGTRNDIGIYTAIDFSGIPTLDIMGGFRYTFFSLSARVNGEFADRKSSAPSLFLGITKKFGEHFATFINIGKAFRLPSISESFYSGISGRKTIIGNANLNPEASLNLDVGCKYYSNNMFLGIYFFTYFINNMIERFKLENDIYTYDNIQNGQISGAELEFQFFPIKNIEVFGHLFYYTGINTQNDQPLNDIPAPRLFLGGKYFINRFWTEVNYRFSFKKQNPGPTEIQNPSFNLLSIKGGFYFSSQFFIYLKLDNIFNTIYYASPDPDIPFAQGRSISVSLHYNF